MIYADFNASSTLCPVVKKYLLERIESGPFANPNSGHHLGRKLMSGIENSRTMIGTILNADPEQIIFNSGSTEAITTIFHSVLTQTNSQMKPLVLISQIEHPVTQETSYLYESKGFTVETIPTKANGVIDIDYLRNITDKYQDKIAMISIMAANNETGVLQPISLISELTHKADAVFVCDTTQFIGKENFDFKKSGIDYAVMSGHKIGALIGTGFMLIKNPTDLKPLFVGGGQENNLRSGTQNYLGIETLAIALDHYKKNRDKLDKLKTAKLEFEKKLKEEIDGATVLGENASRLATTTYVSFPGLHGQSIQLELEAQDIFVTTSSACSDDKPSASGVLSSMGISDAMARGSIRISLSIDSDLNDYKKILDALKYTVNKLNKINCY